MFILGWESLQPGEQHVQSAAAAAKSLQSCLTLCDPIDGSPPASSVPGILQARILEWVAISFSNACMHAKSLQSCPTLQPHGQQPTRLLCPQNSLGKSTGVACRVLLQESVAGMALLITFDRFCYYCSPISTST